MLGWPTALLVVWAVACLSVAWLWSRFQRWNEPRRPTVNDLYRLHARRERLREALEAHARKQLDDAHGDLPQTERRSDA